MKQRFYTLNLYKLLRQRNRMVILGSIAMLSNLFLALTVFFSPERIVLTPACLSKSFWVDHHQVSPEYLEEMSLFFAHLILDVSPASAAYQREVVLRYVAPSLHNALRKQLLTEEERLREGQLSTSFKPVQIKVDARRLEAHLTGDLISYVGGKSAHQARETYLICFRYQHGRLLITHFSSQKDIS